MSPYLRTLDRLVRRGGKLEHYLSAPHQQFLRHGEAFLWIAAPQRTRTSVWKLINNRDGPEYRKYKGPVSNTSHPGCAALTANDAVFGPGHVQSQSSRCRVRLILPFFRKRFFELTF